MPTRGMAAAPGQGTWEATVPPVPRGNPHAALQGALSAALDDFLAALPEPRPSRLEALTTIRTWLADEAHPSGTDGRGSDLQAYLARRQTEGVSRLRAWREARGMKLVDVARRAEISQVFLWQIETRRRVGTLKTLQRIADVLSITVSDMTDAIGPVEA